MIWTRCIWLKIQKNRACCEDSNVTKNVVKDGEFLDKQSSCLLKKGHAAWN
jgi:hypothetical protein